MGTGEMTNLHHGKVESVRDLREDLGVQDFALMTLLLEILFQLGARHLHAKSSQPHRQENGHMGGSVVTGLWFQRLSIQISLLRMST